MPKGLSHYDRSGRARMVDVSGKSATKREAEASAFVAIRPEVLALLPSNPKGDPLEVARFAGITAAKKTSDLIPMCHPLLLMDVVIELEARDNAVEITARVTTVGKTGAEMEALTAVSVTALTLYDMCKAVDKRMVLEDIRLVHKEGGKSGSVSSDG